MEKETLTKVFTNDDFKIQRGALKPEGAEAVITYKAIDSDFADEVEARVDKKMELVSMRTKYKKNFANAAGADDVWDVFKIEDYMGNSSTKARVKEDLKRIKSSNKIVITRKNRKYIAIDNNEVGIAIQDDLDSMMNNKNDVDEVVWAANAFKEIRDKGFNPQVLQEIGYDLRSVKGLVTVYRLDTKNDVIDFSSEDELRKGIMKEIMTIVSKKCAETAEKEYDERSVVALVSLLDEYRKIGTTGEYKSILDITKWTVTEVEKEETVF